MFRSSSPLGENNVLHLLSRTRARVSASRRIARAVAFAVEPLETRVLLSTSYYFSPNGNDNADGHSPATAWKSITKINFLDLDPGDKVLFEGGQTFSDVPDSN